jgi:hypothetical protein
MTTPFTPVTPDKTPGSGNPPQDMNETSEELAAMGGSRNILDAAYSGGADATGAGDSAAAFNAAIAALPAGPGYIDVPAGTYKLGGTVGPLTTGQWIRCAPGVRFSFTGTGDCFRWTDSSSYNARTIQGAGILGRPVIDGTSAGAGSCALHYGDILQFRYDVAVQNFSGAGDIGIHPDNQVYWTEQATGTAWLNNCTRFVVFDCGGATTSTGSFDRSDYTFWINQFGVGFDGVTWQNGAEQTGGRVRVLGNFETAASAPSSAVLRVTGQLPAGHPGAGAFSGLSYLELDVNVEADEGLAFAPQTIHFGAAGNFITGCTGNMSFGAAFAFQQSNLSGGTGQFGYHGTVTGDTTLAQLVANRITFDNEALFLSPLFMGKDSSWPPGTNTGGGWVGVTSAGDLHYLSPGGTDTDLSAGVAGSLLAANNLSDVVSAAAARANLGLGTAATQNSTAFDAAGAAAAVPGQFLCAPNVYAPASQQVFTTTTQTFAAVDTGVVCTNPFTAPGSGTVIVGAYLVADVATAGSFAVFCLCAKGTVTPVAGTIQQIQIAGVTDPAPVPLKFYVSGLTPGTSYQFDLIFATATGQTLKVIANGLSTTTPTFGPLNNGAPVIMTVTGV